MPKILVIDDEPSVLEMLKSHFSLRGYEVLTAIDGLDGLEVLETEQPEVIILDLKMKKLDGDRFLKQVREKNLQTRVLVVSGFQDDALKERVRKLGVDAILDKPASIIELQKKIAELTAVPK